MLFIRNVINYRHFISKMKGKTTIKVTWSDDIFSIFDGLSTQIVLHLIGQYNVLNIVYSYDHSTK